MKVEDIKNLPKEFNFKSNISPFNIVYHAKETKHGYEVTYNNNICNFSKEKMKRSLYNDDYTII